MVKSYSRGWEIYLDGKVWRYTDNDEEYKDQRPCKRCGKPPTKEGYDHCLGHIEGATSACCGHGIDKPMAVINGEFVEIERGKQCVNIKE